MRTTLLNICLLVSISITAQPVTRIEIKSLPSNHSISTGVYIAGSFNGWNPESEHYRFKTNGSGTYYIELPLNEGKYEYKITRGGWDKVETQKNGVSIENRSLTIPATGIVEISIEGWADKFASAPKKSTASKNVNIVKLDFPLPQLKTTRRVWIYLPPAYNSSKQKFPVLYMHDGQNVFEDSSSFAGEWGVDEFMDTIRNNCIVVAVDHGGAKRVNEYSPYDMEGFGKGEGGQYVDFLVKTLKPYIDKHYRTLKKKEHTFVAGSSMGGIISMYAVLKYPKTFGGAGVFSPAFWIGPKIFDDIKVKGEKFKGRIYFYAGKDEGATMVPLTLKAFEEMSKVSKARMSTVIRDDGKHNETTWRREFPLFYQWLLK